MKTAAQVVSVLLACEACHGGKRRAGGHAGREHGGVLMPSVCAPGRGSVPWMCAAGLQFFGARICRGSWVPGAGGLSLLEELVTRLQGTAKRIASTLSCLGEHAFLGVHVCRVFGADCLSVLLLVVYLAGGTDLSSLRKRSSSASSCCSIVFALCLDTY